MNTGSIGSADYMTQVEAARSEADKSKVNITGKTVGDVELSDKAAKYYEKLKKKYGNMEFVLVSPDKKQETEANAAKYSNSSRTVVLIDTDKIEKMAEDEDYRKKYEGIISNAGNQIAQMASSLGSTASAVKTFGMKFDDGGNASFFAVVDKSFAEQRERIQEKREKKAEDAKKAKAKERREQEQERIAGRGKEDKVENGRESDYVTVTANSMEDLSRKIQDVIYEALSDTIYSEQEKKLGQNVDFSI